MNQLDDQLGHEITERGLSGEDDRVRHAGVDAVAQATVERNRDCSAFRSWTFYS